MISIKGLKHYYTDADGKEVKALDGIDLDIKKGEFVAIIGANGSGKSTLARHLNALLLPTDGTCTVGGLDTNNEDNMWDIRQQVGMVFQNPDNQIVAAIVEEDVAFGPENIGVPGEEIRPRVEKALAAVGMSDYAKHAPHLLSGGQKQRIAIAGLMALEPACIVLDEPTAMLDPQGRIEGTYAKQFRFGFAKNNVNEFTAYIDNVKAYGATQPRAVKAPAATTKPAVTPAAPQTFDAGIIVAAVAAVSLAGTVVLKKKR